MDTDGSFDVCSFFSVCSQLVLEAGKIIKEVFESENLLVKIKDGTDPYTEADVKAQTLIVHGIKSFWPNMKIIGEEEEIYKGDLNFDFGGLKADLVSRELFPKLESPHIPLKGVICWIDPLDGTSEFIEGNLDSVTTLIGISINGESKIGVIGKFFTKQEGETPKYEWDPKCYFAHANNPHLYYFDYSNDFAVKEMTLASKKNEKLTICTSKGRRPNPQFQKILDQMSPDEILRAGGAGNKVLFVIDGRSECYFFPRPGIKKWDICAGEALIKSIGGVVTDGANMQLKYEEAKETWVCPKGFVASVSVEKHSYIMQFL